MTHKVSWSNATGTAFTLMWPALPQRAFKQCIPVLVGATITKILYLGGLDKGKFISHSYRGQKHRIWLSAWFSTAGFWWGSSSWSTDDLLLLLSSHLRDRDRQTGEKQASSLAFYYKDTNPMRAPPPWSNHLTKASTSKYHHTEGLEFQHIKIERYI